MTKPQTRNRDQVEALAVELFNVGRKVAQLHYPGSDTLYTWQEIERFQREGHKAVARYVMKHFKRKTLGL